MCLLLGSTASIRAQETPAQPDFTGVYSHRPVRPARRSAGRRGAGRAAGLPPPRPVAVIDGRAGRPATAPKLTPEYLAKWEVMRQSRMAGSSETDPNAKCLSAGMPGMMGMTYGMEIQHTKDKITIYGELNDVYRRIFLDGRKPSQRTLDDPTFAGYSVGHWEGDTLVVDTVAMREDTLLDLFSPHSDQFTVQRAHQIHVAWHPRGSDYGHGSESAARTLHPGSYVSESIAAERRAARVLVCGGSYDGQVGRPFCRVARAP